MRAGVSPSQHAYIQECTVHLMHYIAHSAAVLIRSLKNYEFKASKLRHEDNLAYLELNCRALVSECNCLQGCHTHCRSCKAQTSGPCNSRSSASIVAMLQSYVTVLVSRTGASACLDRGVKRVLQF